MFRNVVKIEDNLPVITNPENRLITGTVVLQLGKRYITWRTLWNWFKLLWH